MDFQDSDGDLSALHLLDPTGQHLSAPIADAKGITSGTLSLYFLVSTAVIGHYGFELWVTDGQNNASNHLPGAFDVRPDDTAALWSTCTLGPAYAGTSLEAVAWSGSRFVTVGPGGAILNSTDGKAWTGCTSPTTLDLHAVTWAMNQFVAVGDQETILLSADGLTWAAWPGSRAAGLTLRGIAGSGSQWVAVGWQEHLPDPEAEVILTSSDAQTWTPVTGTGDGYVYGVHWSGSRFVAVGERWGTLALGRVYTSQNGLAWSATDLDTMYLTTVTSNGSLLVASGPSCPVITTTDGSTWTSVGAGDMIGSQALGRSGYRFLAGGAGGTGNTSTDGTDWSTQVTLPDYSTIKGIAWGDNRWVLVGPTGSVFTSP